MSYDTKLFNDKIFKIRATTVAPVELSNLSDIRYADGTGWDPGFGEGYYFWDGTQWVPMFGSSGGSSLTTVTGTNVGSSVSLTPSGIEYTLSSLTIPSTGNYLINAFISITGPTNDLFDATLSIKVGDTLYFYSSQSSQNSYTDGHGKVNIHLSGIRSFQVDDVVTMYSLSNKNSSTAFLDEYGGLCAIKTT